MNCVKVLTRRVFTSKNKAMTSRPTPAPPVIRPFRVSVEGNLASGKSTLLDYFRQFPYIETHIEPVEKWRDVQGQNLLGLLYKDLTRWNGAFQSYVQLTRTGIQTTPPREGVKIQMFERSLQNSRFCFMENAYKNKLLSEPEYGVLCKWYDWVKSNYDIKLDLIVYLQSTPEIIYHRLLSRNRIEENTVTLDYLEDVHYAHEKWLMDPKQPTNVCILDGDRSKSEIIKFYERVLPTMLRMHRRNEQAAQQV